MATSNFHNVNANNIFAVECTEEWDYDDLIENLKHELDYLDGDGKDEHELRSFPSRVIGTNFSSKLYADFQVEVELQVVVRSGYYAGVNLDWTPTFNLDGEEFCDGSEVAEHLVYSYGYSQRNADRYANWIGTWYERERDSLIERTEAMFANYSQPLVEVARFSNGETIYESASNRRSQLKAALLQS
jgi:hypothetical protein